MAVTHGLNPDVVRQVARTLGASAHTMNDIGQDADRIVKNLQWRGPDVSKLQARWSEGGLRHFHDVAAHLEHASKDLSAQVEQQDDTSNSQSSGTGSGGIQFAGLKTSASASIDDGGGPLDWLGDKAKDAWDGLSDGASDAVDAVGDGLDWLGDRAEDGLSWAQDAGEWAVDTVGGAIAGIGDTIGGALDRLSDVGAAVVDRFHDGLTAAVTGLPRVGDNLAALHAAIAGPLSEGRLPQLAEVGAAALLTTGSAAGALGNLFAGRDLHFLDDGRGTAGPPHPVSGEGTPPTSASALIDSVIAAGKESTPGETNVRITTIPQADGTNKYIVSVPGTQQWGPMGNGQTPMDLTGNLVAMSGQQSAAMEGVQEAMDAVIPPGADVMMVGHSQGAIINSHLVSDPNFMSRYNVTDMMAYGGPIDTASVPPGVNTLSLQHSTDIVPRLDLGGVDIAGIPHPADGAPNVTRVVLPHAGDTSDVFNFGMQHDQSQYQHSMTTAEGADAEAIAHFNQQIAPYLVAPGTHVESVDVPVSRR